jgi:hypothetical protein
MRTQRSVRDVLGHPLGVGVLADRALLAVSDYRRTGRVKQEDREVLTLLCEYLEASRHGANAFRTGSLGAASTDALSASEQVERALPSEEETSDETVDGLLDSVRRMEQAQPVSSQELDRLHAFLDQLAEDMLYEESRVLRSSQSSLWREYR